MPRRGSHGRRSRRAIRARRRAGQQRSAPATRADRRLLWEIPEEAWDTVLASTSGRLLMSRAVIPTCWPVAAGGSSTGVDIGQARDTKARRLHGVEVRRDRPHPVPGARAGGPRHQPRTRSAGQRDTTSGANRRPSASARSPSATPTLRRSPCLPPAGFRPPRRHRRLAVFFASDQSDHIPGQAGPSTAGR